MTVQYATFGDRTTTLVQGGVDTASFTFDTPGADPTEAANLAFQTNPAGNAEIKVEINSSLVLPKLEVNTGNPIGIRENFGGAILDPANPNTLEIKLTGGVNNIDVSDFMVMYKT
jgi:hypothetical protein